MVRQTFPRNQGGPATLPVASEDDGVCVCCGMFVQALQAQGPQQGGREPRAQVRQTGWTSVASGLRPLPQVSTSSLRGPWNFPPAPPSPPLCPTCPLIVIHPLNLEFLAGRAGVLRELVRRGRSAKARMSTFFHLSGRWQLRTPRSLPPRARVTHFLLSVVWPSVDPTLQ